MKRIIVIIYPTTQCVLLNRFSVKIWVFLHNFASFFSVKTSDVTQRSFSQENDLERAKTSRLSFAQLQAQINPFP